MFDKKTKKQKPMSEAAKQRQQFAIRDYYIKKHAAEKRRKKK